MHWKHIGNELHLVETFLQGLDLYCNCCSVFSDMKYLRVQFEQVGGLPCQFQPLHIYVNTHNIKVNKQKKPISIGRYVSQNKVLRCSLDCCTHVIKAVSVLILQKYFEHIM